MAHTEKPKPLQLNRHLLQKEDNWLFLEDFTSSPQLIIRIFPLVRIGANLIFLHLVA